MKRICQGMLLSLLLVPVLIFAAEIKPSLILDHIKVIKIGESGGDELYFDISTHHADQSTVYKRIPSLPMHWLSKMGDKIRGVVLWSEPLLPGKAVTVILSLNEADAYPWNIDDVIGTIKVQLKNKGGKLQARWSIPNRSDKPVIMTEQNVHEQKFDLISTNGHYAVYLNLQSQ